MKLKISVGVDFGKLANEMPKILEKFIENNTKQSAAATKATIDKGLKPLKKSTQEIRQIRGESGNKPLKASGALYKSIKSSKKGLQMLRYGTYHQDGFVPKKIPTPVKKNKVYFVNNKKNIAVPARPFITLGVSKQSTSEMKKSMQKALSRKTPLVLET